MNTLKNNKLIAEFMVNWFEKTDRGDSFIGIGSNMPNSNERESPLYWLTDLEFHNSWDWLMAVVEKIETLGFLIHIDTIDGVKVFNPKTKDMIFVTFTAREYTSKIRETYKAVVEFIKWYNENKQ